jgi:hypothetical protein
MSGGSYNYAFRHVEDFADEVEQKANRANREDQWGDTHPRWDTPSRRAFVAHLRLVATAMRAIEWEDSGDGADEDGAIAAVLGRGP